MYQLPDRREFLDNLRHLAHFSTKAILITTQSAGGFSHLLSALAAAEGDNLFLVDVDLSPVLSVSHALQLCLKRLQGGAAGALLESDEQILAKMQQYAQRLALSGRRALLVFRSADTFGAEKILALATMLHASHGQDSHWSVLVASAPDFSKSLRKDSRFANLLLQLHLKPLSREEFVDYAAGQLGAAVPSRRQLDRHYKKLGGLAETVDAFILEQRAISARRATPPQTTISPARMSAGNGTVHMKSGGSAGERPSPPAKAFAKAGQMPSASLSSARPSVLSTPASFPQSRNGLLRYRIIVLPIFIAALGTAVLAALFFREHSQHMLDEQVAQDSILPALSGLEAGAGANDEALLSESDLSEETFEPEIPIAIWQTDAPLDGSGSSADLVNRIQEQFVRQRAAGGFDQDDLMSNDPASREIAAETAVVVSELPADLKVEAEAEASISDITDRTQLASRLLDGGGAAAEKIPDNQLAPSPSPSAVFPPQQSPPQPETGEIERINVESAPTESPPEATPATSSDWFRSAQWLAQQPNENWTIQMLGSYSEALVVRFLNSRPGLEKAVYIRSTYKNKPWFIVLNGSYATKAEAQRIVQALPGSLKKEDFWIRQIGGLK